MYKQFSSVEVGIALSYFRTDRHGSPQQWRTALALLVYKCAPYLGMHCYHAAYAVQ